MQMSRVKLLQGSCQGISGAPVLLTGFFCPPQVLLAQPRLREGLSVVSCWECGEVLVEVSKSNRAINAGGVCSGKNNSKKKQMKTSSLSVKKMSICSTVAMYFKKNKTQLHWREATAHFFPSITFFRVCSLLSFWFFVFIVATLNGIL